MAEPTDTRILYTNRVLGQAWTLFLEGTLTTVQGSRVLIKSNGMMFSLQPSTTNYAYGERPPDHSPGAYEQISVSADKKALVVNPDIPAAIGYIER